MVITQSQIIAALLPGRRSQNSTEVVLELTGVAAPFFWIELWNMDTHLGYAKLETFPGYQDQNNPNSASFVLTELLSASSPAPSPIASLSGVLWNRLAALEASAGPPFSLLEEDWIVKPRAQSDREECPHEA